MWRGAVRENCPKEGLFRPEPKREQALPGNGAASSQASQSLGFPSVDEMARTGPAQGTCFITEVNFTPSTV